MGFTPDMVYMAMGAPLRVEVCKYDGERAEFWTYDHVHFGSGEHPYSLKVLFQNGKAIQVLYCPTSERDKPYEWHKF